MQRLLELLRCARAEVRGRPLLFVLIPTVVLAAGAFTIRHDVAWSTDLLAHRTELGRDVARRFSACGDFQTGTLVVVGVLGLWGWLRKNRRLQTAAFACLLAASLAGLAATTMRTATGRPRPSANVADGFYGPKISNHYHSFGSAHAATSIGTSSALAVAVPPVGIPLFLLSLGVPWSRFYMHDHYVTDIIVGSGIGIWFGLAFGFAARRLSGDTSRGP